MLWLLTLPAALWPSMGPATVPAVAVITYILIGASHLCIWIWLLQAWDLQLTSAILGLLHHLSLFVRGDGNVSCDVAHECERHAPAGIDELGVQIEEPFRCAYCGVLCMMHFPGRHSAELLLAALIMLMSNSAGLCCLQHPAAGAAVPWRPA